MIYAGVGNRFISDEVFKWLESLAAYLAQTGYNLRSGNAKGSDTAFQMGSRGKYTAFVARQATPEAIELASKFHPAWHMCNDYAKQLHGRNSMIILGENLNEPVKFVACYAVDEENGGTALGIKIARANNIPVFNLYKEEAYQQLLEFIRGNNGMP